MKWIGSKISRLGLWPRIALGISLSYLILFAVFSALGERALHSSANNIVNERVVIAQMAAGEIDEFLHHVFTELTDINRMADFNPFDTDLSVEARSMSNIQRELGSIASSILFLDANGYTVITNPPDMYLAGTDLSDIPYVVQALEADCYFISEPFYDVQTGRPVAAASNPILVNGRFAGVLIGLVDLNGEAIMRPLERAASLGNTGHATLIDDQGRALAATSNIPLLAESEQSDLYRESLSPSQPSVSTTEIILEPNTDKTSLETHVIAFAPLSAVPWGVAVGGNEEDTFAGVQQLRIGLIVLAVISLVSVWIITLSGTRRLIKPIQQLTMAAQRIAAGELNTPLHVSSYGEIGVMTNALARMQKQILKNIADLSMWNQTLEDQVAAKTKEIQAQQTLAQRLLQHNITVQEKERSRLARELHDGIGQVLMAVELSLDRLYKSLPSDDNTAHQHLEKSRQLVEKIWGDLRDVIGDLRPGVLDQLGLVPSLRWISKHVLHPVNIKTTITTNGFPKRLPNEIETTLFRIAQEAMNNVAQHSQATHLTIQLVHESGRITMTLADDGQGFDPATIELNHHNNRGFGLAGMRERALLAGGQVTVTSASGQGTTIQVIVPASMIAATVHGGQLETK